MVNSKRNSIFVLRKVYFKLGLIAIDFPVVALYMNVLKSILQYYCGYNQLIYYNMNQIEMLEPTAMENLLHWHLEDQNLSSTIENKLWMVQHSNLNGRGLFATRDIKRGEIIFIDKPLVLGPRCYSKYLPMCVNCYKSGCPLFPCDNGCGLPVCSDKCENSITHIDMECKYLQNLQPTCGTMWSMDLLQAVVPIRSLRFSQRQKDLVVALQCHNGPRHGREINLLEKNIANAIDEADKEFMLRVCRVFDTNAFETAAVIDNSTSISLRGLYPLGALQNHCCVPNTRHYFNKKGYMITKAAVSITKDEELTMSYTDLLWDTCLRRRYLMISKHFECRCHRCSDPTELDSNISALRCASIECFGSIFSNDPLNSASWVCRECMKKISKRQIEVIRSGISTIVDGVLSGPPRNLIKFIEGELKILVPMTNYFMLDMKFRVISYFGRIDDLHWRDLTEKELELKAQYCKDLISILDQMHCGDCQKKGLILYELFCTKREQHFRKMSYEKNDINKNFSFNEIDENFAEVIKKVMEILQDDIAVSEDLSTVDIVALTHTIT